MQQLRKLPLLAGLHEWLKNANESGSITRQEAVSMIPPLLLGVQPGHRVLDMCAAPGSKTSQLLEALHAAPGGTLPAGFVMANDSDLKRCNLLTHQTKRAGSAGLIVTNHDAATFPELRDGGAAGGPLRFDRVLADVPCSGDGTIRKAPDIWQ
jgi:16S rRNA C967 or C1407 C5-methylase (RsmB/RsmF family)